MQNNNKVDTVFVLMIFCVFAVSVLLVLILSGSAYGNMTEISGEGRNERIVLSYIRTRVRNTDSAGSVYIREINGLSALSLEEVLFDRTFITYIYLYNGWVRELFHEKGLDDFAPEDGVPIIRAGSLDFEVIENGLIRVSTEYGSTLIFPRSAIESEGF